MKDLIKIIDFEGSIHFINPQRIEDITDTERCREIKSQIYFGNSLRVLMSETPEEVIKMLYEGEMKNGKF